MNRDGAKEDAKKISARTRREPKGNAGYAVSRLKGCEIDQLDCGAGGGAANRPSKSNSAAADCMAARTLARCSHSSNFPSKHARLKSAVADSASSRWTPAAKA